MNTIEKYAESCIAEAEVDYIPLWGIAQYFSNNLNIQSVEDVKENSLAVAQKLIEHNILPGQMIKGGGFDFWLGTPKEQLARIILEWPKDNNFLSLGGCWFALKR